VSRWTATLGTSKEVAGAETPWEGTRERREGDARKRYQREITHKQRRGKNKINNRRRMPGTEEMSMEVPMWRGARGINGIEVD